jgi:hypothetical protein
VFKKNYNSAINRKHMNVFLKTDEGQLDTCLYNFIRTFCNSIEMATSIRGENDQAWAHDEHEFFFCTYS